MKRALVLILLVALFTNSFSDVSLTVDIFIEKNGRTHVTEQVQLSLDSEQEVYTYTTAMGAIKTTLDDWKKLSNSEFLTYHTTASPINQRILPQKPFYNSAAGKFYSTISIDYDTLEQIVNITETGPRKTLYTIIPSKLAFKLSPTGDIVLPRFNTLRITIPKETTLVSANPKPDHIVNNTLIWEGPYTLAKFDVRFEMEQSLSEEVQQFFSSLFFFLQNILFNYYFVLIVLAVAIFLFKLRG